MLELIEFTNKNPNPNIAECEKHMVVIQSVLEKWIEYCLLTESTENKECLQEFTEMQIVGLTLCELLHTYYHAPTTNMQDILGEHMDQIILTQSPVEKFTWQEIVDTLTTLQLEMKNFLHFNETGYHISIDLSVMAMLLMKRVGFFVKYKVSVDTSCDTTNTEVAHGILERIDDTWAHVHVKSLCEFLTGLNALLSIVNFALNAKMLSVTHDATETIQLRNHHREASLDDFYQISMICDLLPGSIVQYKNKFSHLFHSISQVVYFHYPQYARKVQAPLDVITSDKSLGANVLPLLMQFQPDIPVLFEHTGAAKQAAHAKHKWSWCCFSNVILLVSAEHGPFCARDLRSLLVHAAT